MAMTEDDDSLHGQRGNTMGRKQKTDLVEKRWERQKAAPAPTRASALDQLPSCVWSDQFDNRDMYDTWINATFRLNPVELFKNMVENLHCDPDDLADIKKDLSHLINKIEKSVSKVTGTATGTDD